MRAVRNIVNTGRTIVCTIHQPSIDIFESFDELLLLKRGRETIFNGQLGKDSKDLVKYFQVSIAQGLASVCCKATSMPPHPLPSFFALLYVLATGTSQQRLADLIQHCPASVVWYDKCLQALQPTGHLPRSA
jgi:hypothetical protein